MKSNLVVTSLILSVLLNAQAWAAETGKTITLEQAYDLTLSSDQSIGIAYVALEIAKLAPLAAFTKLLPQVNGVTSIDGQSARPGSHTAASTTGASNTGTGGFGSRTRYNNMGISVQQPVFDLSFFPAYRQGVAVREGARLTYRAGIRQILFGVAQAYYNVLSQQKLVGVDKEALRLSQEQYDLAQKQANVGVVTRSDVLRAQVVVESARRSLIQDTNTLESLHNVLGNILNLPADKPFQVAAPPDYPSELPPFAAVLGKALAQREDLRSMNQAIERDTEAHNVARSAYVPKIIASLDAARNDQSTPKYANNWQANLSVNVPIFNGGQRELDLRTTSLQIRTTKLQRDQLAKTVEQDVKDSWLNVKSLTESLAALRTQVAAAEQGYLDIKNQYTAGVSTSVDVLTALNDLNTARKDLALQINSLQVALRKLDQAKGVFQQERVNSAPHQ